MGLIKMLVSLGFVMLFALAIISYVSNFASDNSAAVNLGDDSDVSSLQSNLQSEVTNFRVAVNNSDNILDTSNIKTGDENVEGGTQFKVSRGAMLRTLGNVTSLANQKIFGGGVSFGVVTTTLVSFIVLILGLYVWKTWKGGNPD